jgi:hypothetical protein
MKLIPFLNVNVMNEMVISIYVHMHICVLFIWLLYYNLILWNDVIAMFFTFLSQLVDFYNAIFYYKNKLRNLKMLNGYVF